jgi:SNF2 family DNA or RNA helicase
MDNSCGQEEYVRQVLEAYRRTPGTMGTVRRADRLLAAQLYPVHGREEGRREFVARDGWHKHPFVLASSQLMRRSDRAPELLAAVDWDLLILDEAHHARRKGAGGKDRGPNSLLALMRELQRHAKSLLLLTATPMQVAPVEVWDLLDLLGMPPNWNNAGNFVRYFSLIGAGNPSDVDLAFLAQMFRAGGVPTLKDVMKALPKRSEVSVEKVLKALASEAQIPLKRLDTDARRLALEILKRFTPLRRLMARQTRALLREYYQAGKLGSPIAVRDPRDIALDLSPGERALYEAVEHYISDVYNAASAKKRNAVGFVMTIYRKRLASSFHALSCTLKDRLIRLESGAPMEPEQLEEDMGDDEVVDEIPTAEEMVACLAVAGGVEEKDRINGLLKAISQLSTDTKAVRLVDLLQEAFGDGYQSAIVFTGYTDTMDYLKEHLAAHFPGRNVACYAGSGGQRRDLSGQWVSVPKEQIKRDLRLGKIDILVCTDAAGEGLNLQTCGVLVNYDLPWNPMKVEQRIGRIDRIGQKYSKIRFGAFEN